MNNLPTFHVRLFQEKDQEAALSLQDEFIEEFFPEFVGDPRLDEWNKDVNDIKSSYTDGSGVFWVVENGVEVVGMGGIKINEEGPVISRVRVRKIERGKGIGTLLLNHMQRYCISEGYEKVLVDTENHMTSAVRFYERNNFHRIRETTEEIDGKIYTTYFYEKYL
jgi:GNAT superfamily N-acetyltransferase